MSYYPVKTLEQHQKEMLAAVEQKMVQAWGNAQDSQSGVVSEHMYDVYWKLDEWRQRLINHGSIIV